MSARLRRVLRVWCYAVMFGATVVLTDAWVASLTGQRWIVTTAVLIGAVALSWIVEKDGDA